ncbi:MAG: hypothetical protein HQ490_05205 [Lutibacter sp.]|nr:hypothetical protein [Lutibacter sp.]
MAIIKIEIENENKRFIITEGTKEIVNNPGLKSFLINFLGAEITSNEIFLSYTLETKEDILNKLHKILFRYGFEEKHSEEMDVVLKSFYQEEENFKIFSLQAENIKNNNCDKNDFENFINSLSEYVTHRTLYPLQLLSSYHLAFSQNACNFSVPGSGKTSIVYGAYTYLKNLSDDNPKKIDKLLIIGPLSSFGPWENEYLECFGKKSNAKRLLGKLSKSEKKNYLYSHNPSDVTLIGYQGVINLVEELKSFFFIGI